MKKKSSRVAHAVRELREALGKTLSEFENEYGVDRTVVHRWEVGDMEPKPPTLRFLFELGMNVNKPQVAVQFLRPLAEDIGLTPFAVTLAALLTLEGPDAPKHIARLAKRAAELCA